MMKYLEIISDGSCHEGCLTKKFESDREANHGKSVFEARKSNLDFKNVSFQVIVNLLSFQNYKNHTV